MTSSRAKRRICFAFRQGYLTHLFEFRLRPLMFVSTPRTKPPESPPTALRAGFHQQFFERTPTIETKLRTEQANGVRVLRATHSGDCHMYSFQVFELSIRWEEIIR